MNWLNSGDELKRILTRTMDHSATVEMMAIEAKTILYKARLHSPIVSAVYDSLLYESHYEGLQLQDEHLYAVMALELLRAHTELVHAHAEYVAKPVVFRMPYCIRPHVEASTRWQRFCLKLGGIS